MSAENPLLNNLVRMQPPGQNPVLGYLKRSDRGRIVIKDPVMVRPAAGGQVELVKMYSADERPLITLASPANVQIQEVVPGSELEKAFLSVKSGIALAR